MNRVRLPILLVVSRTWKMNISLSPFAPENLVSREKVRPSRPAPALSFSTLRLNLVLTRGILSAFRDGVHLRVYQVTQLRTDDVRYRESTATGPVVLEVVRLTGSAFSDITMDQFLFASLSHTHYWYVVV